MVSVLFPGYLAENDRYLSYWELVSKFDINCIHFVFVAPFHFT